MCWDGSAKVPGEAKLASFPVPSRSEGERPPKGAEKNLLEAIARLHAGAPRDPDLQARARARKLRVNATTATLEAGCARRLAYAFPRVRLALAIDHEAGPGDAGTAPRVERKSLQEIVIQLRHDNAELRRGRDKAVSMAATMVIRMRNMERDVNKEVRKSRRNAKRAKNDNQVVGNVYRLRPDDGEPG